MQWIRRSQGHTFTRVLTDASNEAAHAHRHIGHRHVAPAKTSELASLSSATEWINSPPLTAKGLRGRVVLIQFWTYSCINWIRTVPYVRAWAQKYRDQGLVVIGVHAPEFELERQLANARWGAENCGVDYPIAVDNDFAIWGAFSNQYWPALFLIDGRGRVRYRHFGEREHEQSERAIQKLLVKAGARGIGRNLVSVIPKVPRLPPTGTTSNRRRPTLAPSGETGIAGHAVAAQSVGPGRRLEVGKQAAVLEEANGRIVYRLHARDLNLVMAPGVGGKPVPFRVLIDAQPPGPSHGVDVDEQGKGTLAEPRMYQLIRQPAA